jgi:uncharacterized protein (TIGR03000 family)
MYSVVVLMALTTNAQTPEFGRYGGCYGCYGGYSSCYGGCYGSCYGYTSGHGCYGCYGGTVVYSGCYGCYGGTVVYSGCCGGRIITPAKPSQKQDGKQKDKDGKQKDKDDFTAVTPGGKAAARLIVTLPAEATLTIDDEPTKSTSSTRVFITPALEPGKAYHYVLKATVPVGGKTEVITRKVQVIPGQETRETLTLPLSPVSTTGD